MAVKQARRIRRPPLVRNRFLGACTAALIAVAAGVLVCPSVSAATGRLAYSASRSGYVVSGRSFRHVQAEVRLPGDAACARLWKVVQPHGFSMRVELVSSQSTLQVAITDQPTATGCGRYGVNFIGAGGPAPASFRMSPGDLIQMAVSYGPKSHSITWALADLTRGVAGAAVTIGAKTVYTKALITGGFGSFTAPASRFRAFEFTHSVVVTSSGHRGTLTGPWTTSQVVMTSNGNSSGQVEATSPVLWNGGHNFGTWVHAAS